MGSSFLTALTVGISRLGLPLLLLFVLLLGGVSPALAVNCSDPPYNGVIDGNFVSPPSQIQIDTNCTIRNFQPPNVLTTNFSFYTQPGGNPDRWLVVFDNVVHTGNMSCNNVLGHRIWFTNGSSTQIQEGCQNLLIPVEKIDKQNPAGQSTATIGVPFSYKLTIPVLYDPAMGVVINNSGSLNSLHGITIWDDLNAAGADLTYLSHVAYWQGVDTPVPHTFSNVGGVLTFDFPSDFVIPASDQIVIEITVVLDDTAKNAPGTQFTNTGKWEFGRLIEGTFYEPLPGEWGRTLPMTIVAPELLVTKTGPDLLGGLNLGEWGAFTIDVRNAGTGDAWNATLLDRLPDGATGGMCDMTPQVLGVQVFAADGGTPVSDPLSQGTDFSLSYTGPSGSPACQLNLTMLTAAAKIGPDQHLKITYQSKLDADSTTNGVELRNVAGATQWFSADSSNAGRRAFTRTLTDGTVGTLDHEDAHEVMVALSGVFFEKSVENRTSGKSPATVAAPGDTLRYTLRLYSIDSAITNLAFYDDLGALNASSVFVPGSLTLVSAPSGANTSNTAPFGGTNGAGVLDVRGLSVPAGGEIKVTFDITLASTLTHGTVVTNQADLLQGTSKITVSDDPNFNGQANPDPAVVDEDPTRVLIQTPMPPAKAIVPLKSQATIGEEVVYQITVPATPYPDVLNNLVVHDTLDPALVFVSAAIGATPLTNTGTAPQVSLPIGTIGAGQQVVITLTAKVANLPAANAGDSFTNAASYTHAGVDSGMGAATSPITVVEPQILPTKSVSPAPPATPTVGDILTYTITLPARAGVNLSQAFDVSAVDTLGLGLRYKAGTTKINAVAAPDPALGGGDGVSGQQTLTWAGYDIPAGSTVTITYDAEVLSSVIPGQTLSNGVAVQWTSLDGDLDGERTYSVTAAAPVLTTPPDSTTLTKTLLSDTYDAADASLRVGDLVDYELRLGLQQGTHSGLALTDTLPAGMVFEAFVSADFFGTPGTATPVVSGQTLTWNLGTVVNPGDGDPANDYLVIVYRTRVLNNDALVQQNSTPLTNHATLAYTIGGVPATQLTAGQTITVLQPNLTVSNGAAPAGGDTVIDAGEVITYTVDIVNSGAAPAYDPVLVDTLPSGMRQDGVTTTSITLVNAGTGLPVLPAAYDPVTGVATWNLDSGTADAYTIPAGETLRVVYRVTVDGDVGPGQALTNAARVTLYYSFDDEAVPAGGDASQRELYGPTNTAQANLVTRMPTLTAQKAVTNVTQPALDPKAHPGDRLHYTITIENASDIPLSNFSLADVLDPMFQPDSIGNVTVPDGASYTTSGGTLNVSGLNIASSASNETLTIEFEATLVPVITSGTVVRNQGELIFGGTPFAHTNTTETTIDSAPAFRVEKTSQDLTGDPAVFLAGETLRYTLTIRNVGTEDAVNVQLRDNVPANTAYVAGSTTLNGGAVPDLNGMSPLQAGMPVNAPENSTAGYLRADATAGAANVATVTFDVVVDPAAMEGLIIENQGFVGGEGAGSGPRPGQPSDDPATKDIPDDPTRNVVGKLPLLYALKTVQLHTDFDSRSKGIVDPGDVLVYTIVISNSGAIPATGVAFTDQVPTGTSYVENSLRLNGSALGPDGGVSPLIAGLPVQSSDGPGTGILSAGGSAVITFEVRVRGDEVPPVTDIRNQGRIASNELPQELTDADGIPSNGRQPTIVYVGDVQRVSVTKQVEVVGGKAAEAGSELQYTIRVTNIGSVSATGVKVTDDLSPPLGDQVTYVPGSVTLNGIPVEPDPLAISLLSVNCGDLQQGASAVVRFRVRINPGVPSGTTISNTGVVHWDDPAQSPLTASVSIDVGGRLGSGSLNGSVWHDANLDKLYESAETRLKLWSVELYRQNQLLATVDTDDNGAYRFSGLVPNDGTGESYELRFRAAGAGPNTPSLGNAVSPFINGPQRISGITIASAGNLQGLNLPISPNGVVYDSVRRTSVAGARLAMMNAATNALLPSQCFDDPAQQNQISALDGFYKFDLNFSDPTCQPGGTYLIEVTPPTNGYVATPSQIIPPNGEPTAPFSVPACPGSVDNGDAVPTTTEYCEVTAAASVPSDPPRTAGTIYHLHLTLNNGLGPVQSQVFNNHIPVDPDLEGAVFISKSSSLINVTKGGLVPYTIKVRNTFGNPLYDISIVDRFPPGFKYVEGSARLDGNPREPRINGRELVWDDLDLQFDDERKLQLLLVVGAGVSEGEYVNRAQAINSATGRSVSGEAAATVRVIPDPTFDCTDVIGKVFDDRNLNGQQDPGEEGVAGVRVVTARGLIATTDEHGRFHITCAVVPDEDRGSNFILKLDDRSLPTGYRVTTENPRVQRATRGKMMKFNFGATIHRVVGLDVADGVFEPDTTELRLQWTAKLTRLIEELKKAPAVLRLSYLADVESEGLVRQRLKALKKEIADQWNRSDSGYRLTIETEVFWRRGGPPER